MKYTNNPNSSALSAINGWLILNRKEMIWLALIVGGVLIGAVFVS